MSRSIGELTIAEHALIERLEAVVGTIDEKNELLEKTGVFAGFDEIYREYAESDDFEALKRAIFYFWYQQSEPPFLSGLAHLKKETNDKVFEKLNTLALSGGIDEELTWMLPYYYTITEWLFDSIYHCTGPLKEALTHHGDRWMFDCRRDALKRRGLMGNYWLSINPRD